MSDAASILVIILSVFLAIFLLLAIVLIIYLIRVSRRINAITSSVQGTTEKFEEVLVGVSKVTSPMLIAKLIMRQFKTSKKRKD